MQYSVKDIQASSECILNTIKILVCVEEECKFLTVQCKHALNSTEEILFFVNIFLHNLNNMTSSSLLLIALST